MDIEEISGPRVPEVIRPRIPSNKPDPVGEKAPLLHVRAGTSRYEDVRWWIAEDRVTISSGARRKYKQMLAAKKRNLLSR